MYYAPSPFYNGYGYPAAPFPDQGMYATAAYGAYPFYGNQQQVSWRKELHTPTTKKSEAHTHAQ
jgi:hypothetical protein